MGRNVPLQKDVASLLIEKEHLSGSLFASNLAYFWNITITQ